MTAPSPFSNTRRSLAKTVLTRALIGLFLLGALAVMGVNFFHPGRAQRLCVLEATEARLGGTLLQLERDNERLMAELRRLERGAEGWQALARKEYGMVLDGEVIYRFPPERRD